jgi:ferrous iron transport protein B
VKRIAIVGMPNTGKSTFFNRLTGSSSRVGNWPGVTVDLLGARVVLGGDAVEVVDLPGIYDLHGFSDDEQIVRDFLENNPVDMICVILNASQLDHQLPMALQFCKLGLKPLLLINMIDEADQLGIRIDAAALSHDLKCQVLPMSARHGTGFGDVREALTAGLQNTRPVPLSQLRQNLHPDDELVAHAGKLVSKHISAPSRVVREMTERIDRVLLHPVLGLPLFFLTMFLVFQAVYTLGAPLQDAVALVLDTFRGWALEPLQGILPAAFYGFLVDGLYDGIGTVASFVPVIILFFFFLAVVEDSGYLARAAFLTDSLMARLGLDGRGFVMILMGFGCNVPALMGTRVMRSRPLRLLSMLVIPFALCSARLQVFIFIVTALFTPQQAPLILFFLYMASFAAAFLTALVFGRRLKSNEPFVMELPPYRQPVLKQVLMRGWHEIYHFLRRASTFIVTGVVLVWLLTHYPADDAGAGPDRHQPGHVRDPAVRLCRKGNRDRCAGRHDRPGRRCPGRLPGDPDGQYPGHQLHAVRTAVYALPVYAGHPVQRGTQLEVRRLQPGLVTAACLDRELRLLPGCAPARLLRRRSARLTRARTCGCRRSRRKSLPAQ